MNKADKEYLEKSEKMFDDFENKSFELEYDAEDLSHLRKVRDEIITYLGLINNGINYLEQGNTWMANYWLNKLHDEMSKNNEEEE